MGIQQDAERIAPDSVQGWAEWLSAHHDRGYGVWLVRPRDPGRRSWGYEESVLEALRFGWVDSTRKVLDEDRTMMWFAPRRPQSLWTQPNRERIARLEDEGRLEPAGRAAVGSARRAVRICAIISACRWKRPMRVCKRRSTSPAR